MKAIVLAAGFATRMYPLTRDRAKPLLDVAGRPVLSRLLDRVLSLESVDEVLVVSNHRFLALRAWLERLLPVSSDPLTATAKGCREIRTLE